jgi:hypothetical protein
MPGRKRKPDHLLKHPRKGERVRVRKEYNMRAVEQRGITYKEPILIKSFWRDYTMDQVQNMTDEELIQAIDKYLDEFSARQLKNYKNWDWPIKSEYLAIDPNWKR